MNFLNFFAVSLCFFFFCSMLPSAAESKKKYVGWVIWCQHPIFDANSGLTRKYEWQNLPDLLKQVSAYLVSLEYREGINVSQITIEPLSDSQKSESAALLKGLAKK